MKTLLKMTLAVLMLTVSVLYSIGPVPKLASEDDVSMAPKPFVTDQAAYAHYMPPNYALRIVYCKIIWPDGAEYVYISSSALVQMCTSQAITHAGRDPSIPIQWDPDHVRMLAKKPD